MWQKIDSFYALLDAEAVPGSRLVKAQPDLVSVTDVKVLFS
jgi:hypothetical protein